MDICFDPSLSADECIDKVNDNLKLIQNNRFFKFGTDSLMLSAFVDRKKRKNIAELGCGSGIISLLLASRDRAEKIHAIEVQSYFASLTDRNIRLNGLSDKVYVYEKNVVDVKGDIFGHEVDAVVSNPPYMKMTSGKHNVTEEKLAARHELYGTIDQFITCAARIIKHGGDLFIVYRQDRLTDLLVSMRNNRFEPKLITFVHPDPLSPPSFILIKAKYGAADGGLKVSEPFYIYNSPIKDGAERQYSDKMVSVLENGYMVP